MKIKDIRARHYRIPVHIPFLDGPAQHTPVCVAEVEFEGGLIGRGITSHFLLSAVVAVLEGDLLKLLRGEDARHTERLQERIRKGLNSRWNTGVISMAASVLDQASWDAMGKMDDRPVASLLGGARDSVPAYVTFGFPAYDREQLVAAAKHWADQGQTRLKMVVGEHHGWMEDAARVRAVRDAVGEGVELMIDANQMMHPAEALSLARAIEDCGILWFEEPLTANSPAQLHDFRTRTKIPVAAGQNLGSRQAHFALVLARAVDVLQPHVLYCGGYTEARKIAHMTQCADVTIANGGGWPHFNAHLQAAMTNGWRVEYHLGHAAIGEMLLLEAPTPDHGLIHIPGLPGLGFRDDLSALEEYREQS